MDNLEKKSIIFGISNIQTKSFYIKELDTENPEHIQFSIGLTISGNRESQEIFVEVNSLFYYNNDQSTKFLELTSIITYNIKNYDEVIVIDDNQVTMPEQFHLTLISIAISTARGILAAKTEGSKLKNFYIPILDPKQVIQKEIFKQE